MFEPGNHRWEESGDIFLQGLRKIGGIEGRLLSVADTEVRGLHSRYPVRRIWEISKKGIRQFHFVWCVY